MSKLMRSRFLNTFGGGFFAATVLWVTQVGADEIPVPADGSDALPSEEDFEVLARGPLHEAFATSAPQEPQPGIVVNKQPPAAIDELPPTYEPVEGTDQEAIWIPGYWNWDDERDDYLWVSGAWRVPPIDRRWVPGYWTEKSAGWQWISGFWAPDTVEELEYVEPPPATLESGPSTPAPSAEYFWVPGAWIYRSTAYRWRPGYWCPFEENRVWIPAHYVWTPSGCLFVSGYWDYILPRRGYLYAPVYFRRPVARYRPFGGIRLGNLLLHLFVSPRHNHYYFGDYYGRGHHGRYPLYQYRHAARRFDPLLSYYDAHYRLRGIDYRARLRGWHQYYSSHPQFRPPHTLAAQRPLQLAHASHQHHARSMLAVASQAHGARKQGLHTVQAARVRVQREKLHELAKQRKQVEASTHHQLAAAKGRARQLRLPPHAQASSRGGRDNADVTALRQRQQRLQAGHSNGGKVGGRQSLPSPKPGIGTSGDKPDKRVLGAVADKQHRRLEALSQGAVDAAKLRAAEHKVEQRGKILETRANARMGRQLKASKDQVPGPGKAAADAAATTRDHRIRSLKKLSERSEAKVLQRQPKPIKASSVPQFPNSKGTSKADKPKNSPFDGRIRKSQSSSSRALKSASPKHFRAPRAPAKQPPAMRERAKRPSMRAKSPPSPPKRQSFGKQSSRRMKSSNSRKPQFKPPTKRSGGRKKSK